MQYEWSSETNLKRARVIDLDTWQEIRHVRWCDDVTGEYERCLATIHGGFLGVRDENGKVRAATKRGKARLRVEFLDKTQDPSVTS